MNIMDEMDMLAQTAGAEVVGTELVGRRDKDPALLHPAAFVFTCPESSRLTKF